MRRRPKSTAKTILRKLYQLLALQAVLDDEMRERHNRNMDYWEAEHAASHTKWGGMNVN